MFSDTQFRNRLLDCRTAPASISCFTTGKRSMRQVNVRQLFEDKQERLQLSRVAGADGAERIIDSDEVNTSNKGLIGHLNLIHPNWVQVLSETELDYLRNLDAAQRNDAFRQLEQNGTTCLIVAGANDIPAELIAFANQLEYSVVRFPQGQRAADVAGPPLSRQGAGRVHHAPRRVSRRAGHRRADHRRERRRQKRTRAGADLARQRTGRRRHRRTASHRAGHAGGPLPGVAARLPRSARPGRAQHPHHLRRDGGAAQKEPEAHRAPAKPARRRPVANGAPAAQCHVPGDPGREHQHGEDPGGRRPQPRGAGGSGGAQLRAATARHRQHAGIHRAPRTATALED